MCIKTMKHKHSDFIHAWADGAKIQYLDIGGVWVDTEKPHWFENDIYRIKPKERVVELYLEKKDDILNSYYLEDNDFFNQYWISSFKSFNPNVRFVFDSETNKLKSVEMI